MELQPQRERERKREEAWVVGAGYGDQRASRVETEETWLLQQDPLDHVDRHVTAIVGVAVFVLMLALFKRQN